MSERLSEDLSEVGAEIRRPEGGGQQFKVWRLTEWPVGWLTLKEVEELNWCPTD